MTLDLSPNEMALLLSAVATEGARLNDLAIRMKTINNPSFRQVYLRAGACSDLRSRLRAAARGRGRKPRVGPRFGVPTRREA